MVLYKKAKIKRARGKRNTSKTLSVGNFATSITSNNDEQFCTNNDDRCFNRWMPFKLFKQVLLDSWKIKKIGWEKSTKKIQQPRVWTTKANQIIVAGCVKMNFAKAIYKRELKNKEMWMYTECFKFAQVGKFIWYTCIMKTIGITLFKLLRGTKKQFKNALPKTPTLSNTELLQELLKVDLPKAE